MSDENIALQTTDIGEKKSRKPRGWRGIDLLLWPFWLLSLLTGAKNFRDNPAVGSPLMNGLGLHGLRTRAAYALTRFRRFLLASLVPKAARKLLDRDGILILEDVLSTRDIAAVRDYLAYHVGPARRLTQRDTATNQIILDDTIGSDCEPLHRIRRSGKVWRYLCYAASKVYIPVFFLQNIQHRGGSEVTDPQKTMHSDTFHPTMKAWLFLEDVTLEKGPFHYIMGSHQPTRARLDWEKSQIGKINDGLDVLSAKGSMRLTTEGFKAMALPQASALTVKAGTLVIADTHGFHGRGFAKAGASRLALWTSNRGTPFSPLPIGLFLPESVQHAAIKWNYRRMDRKAAKKQKPSRWEEISARDMLD